MVVNTIINKTTQQCSAKKLEARIVEHENEIRLLKEMVHSLQNSDSGELYNMLNNMIIRMDNIDTKINDIDKKIDTNTSETDGKINDVNEKMLRLFHGRVLLDGLPARRRVH